MLSYRVEGGGGGSVKKRRGEQREYQDKAQYVQPRGFSVVSCQNQPQQIRCVTEHGPSLCAGMLPRTKSFLEFPLRGTKRVGGGPPNPEMFWTKQTERTGTQHETTKPRRGLPGTMPVRGGLRWTVTVQPHRANYYRIEANCIAPAPPLDLGVQCLLAAVVVTLIGASTHQQNEVPKPCLCFAFP